MARFILPIILIGISIAVFFGFTGPMYSDLGQLRATATSYNDALSNSKDLESARDALTREYNAIDPENLAKIEKMLPENIDNIRLILEIGQIAMPYGMVLKDVKYSGGNADKSTAGGGASAQANTKEATNKDYGAWDLEFSTIGTYDNFLNFTRDLEKNLRIVDISSVQFSSNVSSGFGSILGSPSSQSYKYDFKIRTYYLKN